MTRIAIYDTTLRDGSQGEGVNFSLMDKLNITRRLDELGVDYIEGGYPLSNPKDFEYFQKVRELPLRHARVAAFGMTRRKGIGPAEDVGLKALIDAGTAVVAVVGKSWDMQVREVLNVSLEENLHMIADSVAYCKAAGREVFYDAEHFFDGLRRNRDYALQTLRAAQDAGASVVILCDTNGGTLPEEIAAGVDEARRALRVELGIHCHNDCDVAVANSLAGVARGATQVQGTINGIGERCGNADLVSVIANLALKRGHEVLQPGSLARLTEASRFVYETANMNFRNGQPFVGASAFAHKGGMHTHAVARTPASYEHIDPAVVGNERRVLVSELSGQSTILTKTTKYAIANDRPLMLKILSRVQDLENAGYEFEAAEASFDLLVQKCGGPLPAVVRAAVVPGGHRGGGRRRPAHRGEGQGARRRREDAHGQRGRRSRQRAGRGAAEGVAADLPAVGGNAPGGLQGARGERRGRRRRRGCGWWRSGATARACGVRSA